MIVKTYSYRYAEEILQHPKHIDAYNELIEICRGCPIPVFAGKSTKQTSKDVVQQVMNTYFLEAFISKGWEAEPLATPNDSEDSLRSDFRKSFYTGDENSITIQVEVEFGNVASSYRNYFKFQLSYSYDMTDICVIIVPSWHLANRIDSGVSNYEKVLREIPSAKLSITVPVLVVGLFDMDDAGSDLEIWDLKKECTQLKVVQNKNKSFTEAHIRLIKAYVERINNLE
ncbi:BglII/BstYI family type II restriction endonuclease [Anaerosporobacter sp.]|uniref:BglII/BstYI family type II restriction endonuclease n=1 Tax=Anaerosporobacter sp. TaxID=1872529 RepID=UPI00286F9ED0|nr:BglII/BstYI family type II restriction endonuclease [Anaerosporobacter sp.]